MKTTPAKKMHALKAIGLAVAEFVKQAWRLPQYAAIALRERRLRMERADLESERLDRIRHPWKYLGR